MNLVDRWERFWNELRRRQISRHQATHLLNRALCWGKRVFWEENLFKWIKKKIQKNITIKSEKKKSFKNSCFILSIGTSLSVMSIMCSTGSSGINFSLNFCCVNFWMWVVTDIIEKLVLLLVWSNNLLPSVVLFLVRM